MTKSMRAESGLKTKLLSAAGVSIGIALLFGGPITAAHAQEADPPVEQASTLYKLDTVTVTARRREEIAQNVPVSITALGGDVLDELRIENLDDLQTLDPSLSVSASSGRPNSPVYSLRGIRPTEAIYGQDPTVAVYLADVVQSPSQGSNLGMYDLENVQILKGPQGTLFGRNTIGGAILLTPKKPGDVFGGNVMVGAGSYDLVETQVGIDMPVSETFRLRFAGRTIDGGDFQTNVAPGPLNGTKLGGQSTRSARLTAVWEPSSRIENTTLLTYDDVAGSGRGLVPGAIDPDHIRASTREDLIQAFTDGIARGDVREVSSDLRQKDDVSAWGVTNTTAFDITDDITLKTIAAYREVETDVVFDLDATEVPSILTSDQQASLEHASVEVQLLGTALESRLDWVTGLYYYQEEGEEFSPGDFYGGRIIQTGIVENSSYSAFAQASYHITDALTFTGGVRLNEDEREITLGNTFGGFLCLLQVYDGSGTGSLTRLPADDCFIGFSDKFSQPTGVVSLEYQHDDDTLIYATSRLGYRSGGFNLRATQPIQYLPFQPETVTDLEVGIKTDWAVGDTPMRTNLAVFYQKYDDIQRTVAVATPAGSPASVVVNAAKATVFGVELQQTIKPTDNLTFQFNYAYNNPEYDEWIDPATGNDLTRTPFYFTAEHSGNLMVMYEQPLEGDRGELNLVANASYMGDQWINALHTIVTIEGHPDDVRPLLQQEAYWLLDLSAGWSNINGSNVGFDVYVKNAFDEEYKVGGLQLYNGASGFLNAAYGDPRTFGARLSVDF